MPSPLLQRCCQALVALCSAWVLAACGGEGELGSGGTGAAAASAEGTVTGFGSIFVDGARFDDSSAAVTIENLGGGQDDGEARLGQRVDVGFAVEGVATSVKIEPEVVGVVDAVAAGGFTVLGQAVLANTDPAAGPVTQFDGGYAGLADLRMGDLVEVHGVARSAAPGRSIQATLVEKRGAPLPYLRVAGTVAGLGAGPRFTLGALTVDAHNAVIVPGARALAEGQSVVVLASTSALQGTTLNATRVRIRERSNGPVQAYLGGVVSGLVGDRFNLGEVSVTKGGATRVSPANLVLANGQYVQVRGDFAADGSLAATEVKLRGGGLDADLRGTATNVDLLARTFSVRGVSVQAATATFTDCAADWSNSFVEVSGRLGPGGVVADTVLCKPDPQGAVIERRGVAGNVLPLANTFTLTAGGQSLNVRWTLLTFFRDVQRTRESLNGASLRVEGVLVNGVLVATKIRLDR